MRNLSRIVWSSMVALLAGLGAPAAHGQCSSVVFAEDFESSGGSLPPGWSATGLWHMSNTCHWNSPCNGGFDGWRVYYGLEGQCNYDSPILEGELTSPWISLPALPGGGTIALDYCEAEDTECEVEQFHLRVEVQGGPTHSNSIRCEHSQSWMGGTPPYPLTAYAGLTVRLIWDFDAVDDWFNGGKGIAIDNIVITAYSGVGADCNQNVVPDDCEIAMGWLEDCDGDLVPDACNPGTVQVGMCTAQANSVGSGAAIGYQGKPNVLCDAFDLTVVGAPPGQFGLFLYAPDPVIPPTPFGEGSLCIGGGIHRLLPGVLVGPTGTVTKHVDFQSLQGAGQMLPASVWFFQFWYRDPVPVGSGWNLSSSMRVNFAH